MGFCPLLSGLVPGLTGTASLELVDCQGPACEWWNSEKGCCSIVDIDAYQKHFDVAHWDKNDASVPRATILLNEFMGNQDLDGNGLVYGYDFYIAEDDNIPKMLLKTQQTKMFDKTGLTEMTWEEYLSSL